jgi:membrane dipeptidase
VTFFDRAEKGHIDLPRAREGGFGGGFFAVYIPPAQPDPTDLPSAERYEMPLPPPLEFAYAQRAAFAMTASLFRIEARSRGQVNVVRAADELAACLRDGVLAAILHFEGAEAIDPELNALEVFYQAGLRSLGPVWSRPNVFAHGVPFAFPRSPDTGPGLTDAGRELVRACNRLGIMIDLSHLNEQGFWDIAKLSDAPLVATHSNAHALCASTRNLTDRQLDAIRESDGMVGVNFAVCFLRADGHNDPETPLDVLIDHVDYLVERIGIDRVGFGSDFDGAKVPRELGDVAGLPRLIAALRARGYDTAALRKLAHENWLRVLRKTWKA